MQYTEHTKLSKEDDEEGGIEASVSCFNCVSWGDPKAIFNTKKSPTLVCNSEKSELSGEHTGEDQSCEHFTEMEHGRAVPLKYSFNS